MKKMTNSKAERLCGSFCGMLIALLALIGTASLGGCGALNANGDYMVWRQDRSLANYNHYTIKQYNVNASANVNGKFGSTWVNTSRSSWGNGNGGYGGHCDY